MTPLASLRPSLSRYGLLAFALCITAGLASVLSGCGSSEPAAVSAAASSPNAAAPARPAARVASTLRAAVQGWEGTPYRLGGTTRHGVDCSGFMQRLYRDALGVDLARSTRSQVRQGRRVSEDQLRPGDLVFFHPGRKGRHVGVYVGAGEFAHASSSHGVTLSPLDSDYWQDAYWTARRVLRLTPAPLAKTAEAPPAARVPAHAPERAGW